MMEQLMTNNMIDIPIWIENKDGSGQWSDGYGLSDKQYRDLPIEDRSMDVFAPGVIDEDDLIIDETDE